MAGNDFNVVAQSKSGSGYRIKFQDANAAILDGIRCTFFIGSERPDEFTDQKGIVTAPYPHCDPIFIFHTLFPDFVTRIKDDKNGNNRFVVTLHPSLAQVSCKGIDFMIEDDSTISCMHIILCQWKRSSLGNP